MAKNKSYDEEIKQALIQRILEQQQTIAKQKEEISRLNSQKETNYEKK